MKTIEEFLVINPNATLAEYKEYCNNVEKAKADRKANIERLYKKWIAEQDGKYFFIDFNGASRVLFKFSYNETNRGMGSNACKTLCFYSGYDSTYVKVEKREMNFLWLDDLNPYFPEYKKEFGRFGNTGNNKIMEVSEEVANKLFARFDTDVRTFINDIERMF